MSEHLFEIMLIQNEGSKARKRATEHQCEQIIKKVLQDASETGVWLNQTELKNKIKEMLMDTRTENGLYSNLKPLARNTIHKYLVHFEKIGKVEKDKKRRYSWIAYFEIYKKWDQQIRRLVFELKQNAKMLEEQYPSLQDPKSFFEDYVLMLVPVKDGPKLKHHLLFAELADMAQLAPTIWSCYLERLEKAKDLPKMPEDTNKSATVEDGLLIFRRKYPKT